MKRSTGINIICHRISGFAGLMLLVLFMLAATATASATDYHTISSGPWTEPDTWEGGNVPSFAGELNVGDCIFIDHDVTLYDQSFLSGANKFELHVGFNNNATLIIEKNFTISSTIDIIVYSGSSLVVGTPPPAGYDYCDENATENALFLVKGSSLSPSLQIRDQAKFILYGDFKVENKFNIEVLPGGLFKVYGGFTAGNTASVTLSGTGAWIGCDMIFDNDADILIDVGSLHVGGDLLLGNTANLTLIGSSINVGGTICSYPGGGSGATVELIGDEDNPSTITSLHTCEDITLINTEGGITLPIKLLSFSHQVGPGQIIFQWETASEINNNYFTVERSHDMVAWKVTGTVSGAGNSNQQLSYQFTDHLPHEGISYYRLKQTDHDGAHEYFKPLMVEYLAEKNQPEFKVVKSPGQWKVIVPAAEIWQIEVHALNGGMLHSGKAENAFHFPAPGQPVVIRMYNEANPPYARVIM